MSDPLPLPQKLSLPEKFALLSLAATGYVFDSEQAAVGCAAAELGELALRGKLLLRTPKTRVFGLTGYRPYKARIELLNAQPTGLPWADAVLGELSRAGSPVPPHQWIQRDRTAFDRHRGALAARGLIRFGANPLESYPDPNVRTGLINEVRLATEAQRPWDAAQLFLLDLVTDSQLYREHGLSWPSQRRVERARGSGPVQFLPSALRDTSAVLATLVPKRNRPTQGRRITSWG